MLGLIIVIAMPRARIAVVTTVITTMGVATAIGRAVITVIGVALIAAVITAMRVVIVAVVPILVVIRSGRGIALTVTLILVRAARLGAIDIAVLVRGVVGHVHIIGSRPGWQVRYHVRGYRAGRGSNLGSRFNRGRGATGHKQQLDLIE